MTAIDVRSKRVHEGVVRIIPWAPGVLVAAAVLGSYGVVASTAVGIQGAVLTAPLWLGIGWLAGVVARDGGLRAARATLVLALAYAATMFGVFVVRVPVTPARAVSSHPPFGQHPVCELAGFPWPGVEGNGHGLAVERIPFAMGIDALLVNVTVWAVLFGILLWRANATRVRDWLGPAAVFACVGGLCGGWHLGVLFD